MSNRRLLIFLFMMGVTACTCPVRKQSSCIDTPDSWNTMSRFSDDAPLVIDECAKVEQLWWRSLGDPILDTLIELALENNKTLAIAKTRIEEARGERIAAISILYPQFSLTGDASKGNQGFYTTGRILAFADAAIQTNWEVDLFGKNQARLAAANAMVQSEIILRQATMVSLLAEVARNYFDMLNFKRQIVITQKNLDSQRRTFELTKEQLSGGLASDFDVQRAGAQASATEARIPLLHISYEMASNRLNVLLGSTPGVYDDLYQAHHELKPLDRQIVLAAPATVLATRPDVRAAERKFAVTISEHDAAVRALFPTLSLTAFYGLQHMTLFNTAPTWNVMTNLIQPLLNFGRIEADIKITSAREKGAFLEYQETVLEALEDMEDALANYLYEIIRNTSLQQAAEQNFKAVELANQQYTNGYTALIDVLVVERNALEIQSSLAESDAKLRKDLVNIYTAAGGGWAYDPSP